MLTRNEIKEGYKSYSLFCPICRSKFDCKIKPIIDLRKGKVKKLGYYVKGTYECECGYSLINLKEVVSMPRNIF